MPAHWAPGEVRRHTTHWKHYRPVRTIAAVALGAASALALPVTAQAHDIPATSAVTTLAADATGPTYLVAVLDGRNEVPTTPDRPPGAHGQAVQVLRIRGDQVAFAVSWTGIDAPTGGALQVGVAGVNGSVSVPLFGAGVPGSLHAATGAVTVTDPALLTALRTDPVGFYVNLPTAGYPNGAVRGQLHTVGHPIDLTAVLHGGPLTALLDGDQQVPAAGDPHGHAAVFVAARGRQVDFSATWSGIGAPTDGHLHTASRATGPVSVPLFAAPSRPAGVDQRRRRHRRRPRPHGAQRHQRPSRRLLRGPAHGRLPRRRGTRSTVPHRRPRRHCRGFPFAARVLSGAQIYACTQQPGGTFAYTQYVSPTWRAASSTPSSPPTPAHRNGSHLTAAR